MSQPSEAPRPLSILQAVHCFGLLLGSLILFATGCATTRSVDWASRIGVLTYDEAVLEMGVPERQATLQRWRAR